MSRVIKKLLLLVVFFVFIFIFSCCTKEVFAEDPVAQCQAEGGFCSTANFCNLNVGNGQYAQFDDAGNRLCGGAQPVCCGTTFFLEPTCNTAPVTSRCANAYNYNTWNNNGSNVVCDNSWNETNYTGTINGCNPNQPYSCQQCGFICSSNACPVENGYMNSKNYENCVGQQYCHVPIPNCWTSPNALISQTACGGAPYNTCNANNGTKNQTWQHQGNQICYYSNYPVNNVACTQDVCDNGNGYTCQSSKCAKTMSGKVTNSVTGAGIPNVVIAGGGTTDANGNWSNTNMAYNTAFTFTPPTTAGSAPCNNGYNCGQGSGSPNPASYTGTVGNAGDCGTNCNFTYTPGSITGHVWIDNDHNGIQNGEPNAGAGILVTDDQGDYDYTDNSGIYLLNNLNNGTYTVDVHDFQGYKTITSPQTLTVPPNRVNINFGIAPAYAITGRVFTDYNYNNIFDPEDTGYVPPPAVNVVAKDSGGATVATIPVIAQTALNVQNSSFETASGVTGCGNGMANWLYAQGGTGTGCMNQDCGTAYPTGSVGCSLKINATAVSSDYNVDAYQVAIPITTGIAYKVSFAAKAQAARAITAGIVQLGAPYRNYISKTFNITTTWTMYTYIFTSDDTDANGRLIFGVGSVLNDPVWIDAVSIYPMSYAVPKLYDGNFTLSLAPLPPNTAQSPPVQNPATIADADNNAEDLGISPLYFVSGNVYQDLNKTACWEPAYDPLYKIAGTKVTFTNAQYGDNLPFDVLNGVYNTGKTIHAGIWNVSYSIPATYKATWPNGGTTIVTLGTPGKTIACDTTLAQNPVCW